METFQELLFARQLIPRKCSLCSQGRTKVVHMVNKAKSVAIENELEEKKQSSRLLWKALKKR